MSKKSVGTTQIVLHQPKTFGTNLNFLGPIEGEDIIFLTLKSRNKMAVERLRPKNSFPGIKKEKEMNTFPFPVCTAN